MGDQPLSVHDLRNRWKPVKERLHTQRSDHPTAILLLDTLDFRNVTARLTSQEK